MCGCSVCGELNRCKRGELRRGGDDRRPRRVRPARADRFTRRLRNRGPENAGHHHPSRPQEEDLHRRLCRGARRRGGDAQEAPGHAADGDPAHDADRGAAPGGRPGALAAQGGAARRGGDPRVALAQLRQPGGARGGGLAAAAAHVRDVPRPPGAARRDDGARADDGARVAAPPADRDGRAADAARGAHVERCGDLAPQRRVRRQHRGVVDGAAPAVAAAASPRSRRRSASRTRRRASGRSSRPSASRPRGHPQRTIRRAMGFWRRFRPAEALPR